VKAPASPTAVAEAVVERRRSPEVKLVVIRQKREANRGGELGQPLSESVTSQ